MGLLDSIFGDKPNQKNIEKLVLKVKERYAQPEYRREAMDKLLAWGTPESYAALLGRFTVVVQSPHWDEEEKRWLVDELATRGEPARAALKIFLAKDDHVAFAAKALRQLSPSAEAWIEDLIATLQARPPHDHRTTQGKAELINTLVDAQAQKAVAPMLAYLSDHADDVQMATLDGLGKLFAAANDDDKAAVSARLREIVADDGRSARVLRQAASVMAELKVAVDPAKPLAPAVAEDFIVKDGVLAASR
ncbi:MAG: hypothetical protein Q8O67_24610 [Deltaproteobacteria bacterium]|nr:hypothetical protein [Deltaproteobacteria bacterium]